MTAYTDGIIVFIPEKTHDAYHVVNVHHIQSVSPAGEGADGSYKSKVMLHDLDQFGNRLYFKSCDDARYIGAAMAQALLNEWKQNQGSWPVPVQVKENDVG